MKLTIKKNILVECLKNINNLINNNAVSLVFSAIHIKTLDGKLIFIATNGVSSYQQIVSDVTIKEDGDILIKGKLFYDIVSKINAEEITINQLDETILQVKAGQFSCDINLLDNISFPIIEKFNYDGWKKVTIDYDTLMNIDSKIRPFVANVNNQYAILNSISFTAIDEKEMECIASDSFRIGYYKFNYSGDMVNFNMGPEIIDTAVSILSSRKNKSVDFFFNDKKCILKVDDTLINFSLYENNYPSNVSKALNTEQKHSFTVNLADLYNALSRGFVLISGEKRPTGNFKIENGKLTIKIISSNIGNSFEELDLIKSDVESYEIKLNVRSFIELLATIKSNTVTFNFNSENAPIVITSENPYFKNLILPLRTI